MLAKTITGYIIITIFALSACSQTKTTINNFTAPEFKLEATRTVALIKLDAEYLSEDEIAIADAKFLKEIETRFKDIKFYDAASVSKTLKEKNIGNVWDSFWKNYISTNNVDETLLFDLAEELKVNAVLHGQVIEVNKVYGEHRKTIGETT